MTTWAAMLRGINVGGKTVLPMADLRAVAASCWFGDVRTYIQSGNLVFTSSPEDPAETLATALATHTGRRITVFSRTATAMAAVVEQAPRPRWEPAVRHVMFTAGSAAAAVESLDPASFLPDEVDVRDREIHIHCPNGFGRSKLAERLSRYQNGTIRNWRTVTTLAEMVAEP